MLSIDLAVSNNIFKVSFYVVIFVIDHVCVCTVQRHLLFYCGIKKLIHSFFTYKIQTFLFIQGSCKYSATKMRNIMFNFSTVGSCIALALSFSVCQTSGNGEEIMCKIGTPVNRIELACWPVIACALRLFLKAWDNLLSSACVQVSWCLQLNWLGLAARAYFKTLGLWSSWPA